MKLLPRRNSEPAATDDAAAEPADHSPESTAMAGKGRPTPKRRDVTGVRGPVTAPKTRKEAYARQKQQNKAARTARRAPTEQMTVAQRRAALKAGDPSVLPRRDQGTTRKLARDYVDSRRMFSNYLLVLFPLLFVCFFIRPLEIVILVVFVGFLIEWFLVGRRIHKIAMDRHGEAQGGPMTIGFYAGSRAYLPRRWRLPAPVLQRGDEI